MGLRLRVAVRVGLEVCEFQAEYEVRALGVEAYTRRRSLKFSGSGFWEMGLRFWSWCV